MRNIIDAIITLIKNGNVNLSDSRVGINRITDEGRALENYVKNLFADTFNYSENERLEKWSEVFSYLGNDSNPPDIMLKNGDAVEVKKIKSDGAALALNSSSPKKFLSISNPMISNACRNAELWNEKDIIYAVGVADDNRLKKLCMIYGRDYCTGDECYNKIRQLIKNGVETAEGIEFSATRELGRVNHTDPLGITYLRIRGMWHIENPWKVFNYVYQGNLNVNFNFMCIINSEKWASLENCDKLFELQKNYPALKISDVKIKNPDNPAKLKNAKLITYEI